MASSLDVREILSLPPAASGSGSLQPPPRKLVHPTKKPDGISRELYNLMGDNAPSLMSAQSLVGGDRGKVRYKEAKGMRGKKVKWEWTTFTPVARQEDGLQVGHWTRVTDDNPNESVEHFGRFNLNAPSLLSYSQIEYDAHLADPDWSPQETAYLFLLLQEYDLRFLIVADRYEYSPVSGRTQSAASRGRARAQSSMPAIETGGVRRRSVEEIKDRYYTICRRLMRARPAADETGKTKLVEAYSFDKSREVKRKQYTSELFHLSQAEIQEEETLFLEIKRMEQIERRYRADRDDLMRTVMGLDSGLINLDQANSEGVLGGDKRKRKKGEVDESLPITASPVPVSAPSRKKQEQSAAWDAARGIYRAPAATSIYIAPKHSQVSAHLRSTKLAQPKISVAHRIGELMAEYGVGMTKLVMPTRPNLEVFEKVLVTATALVEMKRQVERVEQEIRTLKAQKEGGWVIPTQEIAATKKRSASVSSAATSTVSTNKRQRMI